VQPQGQLQQQPQAPAQGQQPPNIWFQDFYRIRKKVLAIANQYWIENRQGQTMAYSKQKLLRLKEDIRIFSDESMQYELFRIQQTQVIDAWGHFAIIDSATGYSIGGFRRKALMSGFVADTYEILDPYGNMIGNLAESTGAGFLRKFINIIPETLYMDIHGQHVAEIKQRFKIIGDIWEVECMHFPPHLDRRLLLGAIILMGMVERSRK
jgi:uncharacterized protein YxjI